MYLVLEELIEGQGLSSDLVLSETSNIEHIRLYLAFINVPTDAEFQVVVNHSILSDIVYGADLPSQFGHGFVDFKISVQLAKNTPHTIGLISNNYSFSESNYIGWIRDRETQKLKLEIWSKK